MKTKQTFHWIWITIDKSLVKWADDFMATTLCDAKYIDDDLAWSAWDNGHSGNILFNVVD